jgi:hypothetical protein
MPVRFGYNFLDSVGEIVLGTIAPSGNGQAEESMAGKARPQPPFSDCGF